MNLSKLVGVALVCALQFVATISLQAACPINVNIANTGTAGADIAFNVDWSKSQEQGAGSKHWLCEGDGRRKCPTTSSTVELPPATGSSVSETFKADTGGCDINRTIYLYLDATINGQTQSNTMSCALAKTKQSDQTLSVTMLWKASGQIGPPNNPNCKIENQ